MLSQRDSFTFQVLKSRINPQVYKHYLIFCYYLFRINELRDCCWISDSYFVRKKYLIKYIYIKNIPSKGEELLCRDKHIYSAHILT